MHYTNRCILLGQSALRSDVTRRNLILTALRCLQRGGVASHCYLSNRSWDATTKNLSVHLPIASSSDLQMPSRKPDCPHCQIQESALNLDRSEIHQRDAQGAPPRISECVSQNPTEIYPKRSTRSQGLNRRGRFISPRPCRHASHLLGRYTL